MADIPRVRRPGRLRSRAARVAGMSLIEHWNGSTWPITA
jgi:hypothetical protein